MITQVAKAPVPLAFAPALLTKRGFFISFCALVYAGVPFNEIPHILFNESY